MGNARRLVSGCLDRSIICIPSSDGLFSKSWTIFQTLLVVCLFSRTGE